MEFRDESVIIGRAAPVLLADDGTVLPVGSDTEATLMALAPAHAGEPTAGVLAEEWVLTRRQRFTLALALVLALASGVVAVALAVSLAA
jgi:hypothetical protein